MAPAHNGKCRSCGVRYASLSETRAGSASRYTAPCGHVVTVVRDTRDKAAFIGPAHKEGAWKAALDFEERLLGKAQ